MSEPAQGVVRLCPELLTERLRLRGFVDGDLDVYAGWLADAETVRFIGGKPMARDDAWRSLATMVGHWVLRGYGMWAVVEKESGALVGRVGLWNPEGWPGVEVGWLVDREHRGKGYAKEAARAAVGFAFGALGLTRVLSIIHVDNAASVAVARSLGETLVEHREIRGNPCGIWALEARDAAEG